MTGQMRQGDIRQRRIAAAKGVAALVGLLATAAGSALAQVPVPRPPADTARFLEAAKLAYEALPLAERIDIQDGLVWSGDYAGALDGTFGRMTFEAIAAFQSRSRLAPDGILTPAARKLLADGATAKKTALGFQAVDDKATGVRIHLPTKLLGPAKKSADGSGWIGREGRIRVDTHATADTDLAGFYERMKADAPGRKITYAVLRPDWFVISDEIGGFHRYARFARGAEGIRGFFFSLDASLATELDRVVIATAGRFEPFPGGTSAAVTPVATPAGPGAPKSPPTIPVTAPAAAAAALASGLAVTPDKVLTAAEAVAGCRTVSVGGKPATIATADAGGIATLAVAGGGKAGAIRLDPAPGAATVLAIGDGGGRAATVAIPAETTEARARAVLQRGGQGAPVFAASGGLAGLVLGRPDEARAIAGLIPSADYRLAPGSAVEAAITAAGGAIDRTAAGGPAITTGRLVGEWTGRIVAVECRR